jgi:hypothetical protein
MPRSDHSRHSRFRAAGASAVGKLQGYVDPSHGESSKSTPVRPVAGKTFGGCLLVWGLCTLFAPTRRLLYPKRRT